MTIAKIYEKYRIMPMLRQHMLWVAAVAAITCENFNKTLNKTDIISACLLHDIGNIIKFDLKLIPQSTQPEGLEYWTQVRQEFIQRYGAKEHIATKLIMREIGIKQRVADLVLRTGFSKATATANSKDFGLKIRLYADNRVEPEGIASLAKRMQQGHARTLKNKGKHRNGKEFNTLAAQLELIEQQIFENCSLTPEDITTSTVKPLLDDLLELEV